MAATASTTLISSQFISGKLPASQRYLRSSVVAAAAVATPPASTRGSKSLYEVLQVKETASVREIKAAYRSLAKRAHPDVAAVGSGDFLEIRQAYETLSDPQERARYDLEFNRVNRIGLEIMEIGYGFGLRFSDSGRMGMGLRRWETDQCW